MLPRSLIHFFIRRPFILVTCVLFVVCVSLLLLGNNHLEINKQHDNANKDYAVRQQESHIPKQAVYKESTVTDGCSTVKLDPFNKEIMTYMIDFGDYKCSPVNELEITFENNQLKLTGFGINFVTTSEILKGDDKEEYKLAEASFLVEPRISRPSLIKGKVGSIQNQASQLCVTPEKYDPVNPPKEIDIIFSSSCGNDLSRFAYLASGSIYHNITKKCLGPVEGAKKSMKNVKLVLKDNCDEVFESTSDGLLKHSSGSCVHPLWGGMKPQEGQKLCLYPNCMQEKRLEYKWYVVDVGALGKSTVGGELTKELNFVQVDFTDTKKINAFLLTVQPIKLHSPEKINLVPNVIIIVLDEVSSSHFKRKLPVSYKWMVEDMQFVEYSVHSAIENSVKENIAALIFGHTVETDGSLYKMARNSNYATLYSGDRTIVLPDNVDAHHSSVPLFAALRKYYNLANGNLCVASHPIYDLTFNYLRSFLQAYSKTPKLAVTVLSQITQGNFNFLGYMDNALTKLLRELRELKNTVIFVQTIRGSNVGKLSQIKESLYEHRRPLLATYLSEDLQSSKTFVSGRTGSLTTPYDVYVTVANLLSGNPVHHKYGRSLFAKEAPRNCLQTGVPSSMCPCD